MKKKLLFVLVIVLILGVAVGVHLLNKEAKAEDIVTFDLRIINCVACEAFEETFNYTYIAFYWGEFVGYTMVAQFTSTNSNGSHYDFYWTVDMDDPMFDGCDGYAWCWNPNWVCDDFSPVYIDHRPEGEEEFQTYGVCLCEPPWPPD